MDAKIFGIVIGKCSHVEQVDDTLVIQFDDFTPSDKFGPMLGATKGPLAIDFTAGTWTKYGEDGMSTTATGALLDLWSRLREAAFEQAS